MDAPQPYSVVYDSFDAIPSAWQDLCGGDLAMDLKVLGIFQRTFREQCRCWGVMVFNAAGKAIGCAALCIFDTELMDVSSRALKRCRDLARLIWPGMGRMKVLFCGLPFPPGTAHLYAPEHRHAALVVAEVDAVMRRLARAEKCRLLVFKEFTDAAGPVAEALAQRGYVRGPIPPMHLFHESFNQFSDYLRALKRRYRMQIQRSQRKLHAAGFEVLCGRGQDFFLRHIGERDYPLYLAVHSRAEHKLEQVPFSFFRELAGALDKEVSLTLLRRDGRVCAFTFAITRGTHYNLYSGLDYTLNGEGDLYFNLFYNDMDQAFRTGASLLHLGQTSDQFKARLGTRLQPLYFFVRTSSRWQQWLLRALSPLVFPKITPVKSHDVFALPTA